MDNEAPVRDIKAELCPTCKAFLVRGACRECTDREINEREHKRKLDRLSPMCDTLRERLRLSMDMDMDASDLEIVEACESNRDVLTVIARALGVDSNDCEGIELRIGVLRYAEGKASDLESKHEYFLGKYDALKWRHEHALQSAYHLAALACDVTGMNARSIRNAADRSAKV